VVRRRSGARAGRASDFGFVLETDPPPEAFAAAFEGMAARFEDFTPVWNDLAPEMAAGLLGVIDSKGSDIGETWAAPFAPYVNRKVREGYGDTDLLRTGDLRRKIGAGTIVRIGKRVVSVGLSGKDAQRAAGATFGFTGGPRRRPILGISASTKRTIEDAIVGYLESAVAEGLAVVGA
jgi:hypothetical protein